MVKNAEGTGVVSRRGTYETSLLVRCGSYRGKILEYAASQ